jgi:hypothetical protein
MLRISLATLEDGIKENMTKKESNEKCGKITQQLQIGVEWQQEKYKLSGMFANAKPNLMSKRCQRRYTINGMVVHSLAGTVGCIVEKLEIALVVYSKLDIVFRECSLDPIEVRGCVVLHNA